MGNHSPDSNNTDLESTTTDNDDNDDDDDTWEQVGKKNRSVITRHAQIDKSPIMDLFGGIFRSAVHKSGETDSATLEPFFTLQLDIQPEHVKSVRDAMENFVCKEVLTDITSGKNKKVIDATKKITIERLPRILILHLKAFVYEKIGNGSGNSIGNGNGGYGCMKINKCVEFEGHMEISKDLLSPNVRSKYASPSSRRYNLFAVIGHHGEKAHGGHYTADIYHKGLNCWLKTDDAIVRHESKSSVFKMNENSMRVPYLLYYERVENC